MGVFDGMSDEEIRRALGEGEKPAHKRQNDDGTVALYFLGQLTSDEIGAIYSCVVNTGKLLARGECKTEEGRNSVSIAMMRAARIATLLETYTLAMRVNAANKQ